MLEKIEDLRRRKKGSELALVGGAAQKRSLLSDDEGIKPASLVVEEGKLEDSAMQGTSRPRRGG